MKQKAAIEKRIHVKKKTYPQWSESVERLLLYADIMGFKSRVLSTTHENLKDQLSIFRNQWQAKMSPLQIKDYLRSGV